MENIVKSYYLILRAAENLKKEIKLIENDPLEQMQLTTKGEEDLYWLKNHAKRIIHLTDMNERHIEDILDDNCGYVFNIEKILEQMED